MDDCCCFQSATGISSSGNATNVDFTGIIATIDANFQTYSNNSNIVSSNISNLYYNDGLLNSNISNLIYYNDSNISNIYYNTGYIDSNLLWWRYELLSTQAELAVTKLNVTAISTQQNILSTTVSAQGVTLAYHTGQINALEPKVANLENNTFTKEQTSNIFITSNVFSNVLSNTSNILANYNNLYNRPIIFTQEETSNIFITSNVFSNVLSNTSNTLADYNNLYNKPDVYTKTEIDINNYTKTQTDNTFTTLVQSNLLYLTLKNDITNTNNNNKWIINGSNLYTLDYNIGIGKTNANYKVDINGSLSSTDYRFNDKQLFSLLPTDSPIFNSGISTQISSNEYYVSYTQSDTMILNKSYTVDILIVAGGGRGGNGGFAGGGGAGEVIYIPNYILPQGVYNITIGIDSATPANRISKLYYQPTFTDLITANGGGDGGSVIRSYSIERRYPPKLYNSVTARTSTTFNGQASFKTTMTLDTSGITYGSGVYDVWFSTIFTTTGYDGHLCFNYVENATTGQWATISTQYSTTSPFGYSGTRYLVESTYKGEFICIKLPVAIALTSYSIVAVNSTEGAGRAPKNFRLYASNNGTSWTTLQTITGATYTTRVYNNTGLSANTTLYSYYGIVINQIIGSGTTSGITQIAEWILNGKEYFVNYINDTPGGSGGGGSGGADAYITNQTGSVAGSPYNVTYSKLTPGADGINANGGNGGSALISGRYTDPISGIQVGGGGSGATASSIPTTKINYGDGGDGNGGLGRQGIIIMKFTSSDIITKFLEYADYNKLFNKPNLLSKEETSNIFITSNVLSNTSNTLANYNNLYNKPDIYTKTQIDNNIYTKTQIDTNIYTKTQIDNNIYTKTQSDTNYYTKANVYTKTESDNNYYNKTLVYTKTESDNNYYTKTQSDTNYYNKSQIDSFNAYRPMTSNITQKLTGSILSLTLVSGGSGYASFLTNQPLIFTGGGGQNASGTYNTDASGSVNSITLTDGGILYTSTGVQVKAGTGNAVISATMGYFDFHNIYSALNVNGKPDIVYKRCDLAFGTRDPTGISYQEGIDGLAGALGTNGFCGLRVKDERMFLIANSNLIQTSFENNYVGARKNIFLTAQTSNIELMCSSVNAQILMKSKTTFEKEVIFTGGVSKKIPKYFTTSRIASFDGISCLAFDINLQTNGVNTTTILGYVFRVFRISFFFITKAPRFQWTPRTFEIHMSSFDANSVSAFDGYSAYSSLDKSYNYQWFLYRQNFSQITFCCPTALFGTTHLDVGFVLEDLLAI